MKRYWRFTNNEAELELLLKGRLRMSYNHRTGESEGGLSVSSGPRPMKRVYDGYYSFFYEVLGTQIRCGSNGEPILAMDSIRPVTALMEVL